MIPGEDKATGIKLLAGATPEEWDMKPLAGATPEEWECPTDPVINLAPGLPVLWRATWGCIPIPWRMLSPRLCLGLRMTLSEHSESSVSADSASHPFL